MTAPPTPVFTKTRELLGLIRRLAGTTQLIYEDRDGGGRPVDMVRIPFDSAAMIVLGEISALVDDEARHGHHRWDRMKREWVPLAIENGVARVRGGRG